MKVGIVDLPSCETATGVVVVIDVLRAFTTAAFAFDAGVSEIRLVSTVEEAFELKKNDPDVRLMGEVGGAPIEGFDYDNSPLSFLKDIPKGIRCVQRTTAGTQGMVRSIRAEHLFAGSFVCASATIDAVRQLKPEAVTFVVTGRYADRDGDEDLAFAEYASKVLLGESVDPKPFLKRIETSDWGREFSSTNYAYFSTEDLRLAQELDRFSFAMKVRRAGANLTLLPSR